MVKNGFGRLLGFASSDENGSFSIKLKDGSTENLTISASMLGYRNYSAPLVCDGKRVTISMEDGAIEPEGGGRKGGPDTGERRHHHI